MRGEREAHADQVPAVVRRLLEAREVLPDRDRRQGEGRALEADVCREGYTRCSVGIKRASGV